VNPVIEAEDFYSLTGSGKKVQKISANGNPNEFEVAKL
jgi:hypothetical protein